MQGPALGGGSREGGPRFIPSGTRSVQNGYSHRTGLCRSPTAPVPPPPSCLTSGESPSSQKLGSHRQNGSQQNLPGRNLRQVRTVRPARSRRAAYRPPRGSNTRKSPEGQAKEVQTVSRAFGAPDPPCKGSSLAPSAQAACTALPQPLSEAASCPAPLSPRSLVAPFSVLPGAHTRAPPLGPSPVHPGPGCQHPEDTDRCASPLPRAWAPTASGAYKPQDWGCVPSRYTRTSPSGQRGVQGYLHYRGALRLKGNREHETPVLPHGVTQRGYPTGSSSRKCFPEQGPQTTAGPSPRGTPLRRPPGQEARSCPRGLPVQARGARPPWKGSRHTASLG